MKNDNGESFNNFNEEILIKDRMAIAGGYTKKSIEILSSNNLNLYEDVKEDNNEDNNDESEKNDIEVPKKNEQKRNSQTKNIQKNNILLVKPSKFKKEKEKNEEDLFFINKDNTKNKKNNENLKDEYDNEDSKNKSSSSFNKEENEKNINNKKPKKDRLIKMIKRKKTKYNININTNDNEEKDELENYKPDFNIKIFYEGKGLTIKISKEDNFSNCMLIIQKKLLPFYKLCDYDILYKLKNLDPKIVGNEKLVDIIDDSDDSPTFYLRKKSKKNINNKDTTVSIENFPSFTDLATELNKFFEKEKRESNFTVDYKGSICKVSFSESEKAFSLIIFLTKIKKNNPIFKRLKISMDYKLNAIIDVKQLRQKPIKLILPLINKNNKTIDNNRNDYNKKLIKINTEKQINNFKSRNYNILNYNNNFNSMGNQKKREYDSYMSSIKDKEIIHSESKLIKNKLKKHESSLEKYKQNNRKSRNIIETNYIIDSQQNINSNNINNNNNDSISEKSEKINPKFSRLRSTNFIFDLSKYQKKNTLRNNSINYRKDVNDNENENENERYFSPKMGPIKKSNFYNLFVNNVSKKYKDHLKDKNNIKDSLLKLKLI